MFHKNNVIQLSSMDYDKINTESNKFDIIIKHYRIMGGVSALEQTN